MTWNWQKTDWPKFTWNRQRLELAEREFLVGGGVFVGAVRHLCEDERNQLTVEAMSSEAVTTSEIEGEILDRAGVQSSIQRQLGLTASDRFFFHATRAAYKNMVSLHNAYYHLDFH